MHMMGKRKYKCDMQDSKSFMFADYKGDYNKVST